LPDLTSADLSFQNLNSWALHPRWPELRDSTPDGKAIARNPSTKGEAWEWPAVPATVEGDDDGTLDGASVEALSETNSDSSQVRVPPSTPLPRPKKQKPLRLSLAGLYFLPPDVGPQILARLTRLTELDLSDTHKRYGLDVSFAAKLSNLASLAARRCLLHRVLPIADDDPLQDFKYTPSTPEKRRALEAEVERGGAGAAEAHCARESEKLHLKFGHPVVRLRRLLACEHLHTLDLRGCFLKALPLPPRAHDKNSPHRMAAAAVAEDDSSDGVKANEDELKNALPLLKANRLAFDARPVTVYCALNSFGEWQGGLAMAFTLPGYARFEDVRKAFIERLEGTVPPEELVGIRSHAVGFPNLRLCDALGYPSNFRPAANPWASKQEWHARNTSSYLVEVATGIRINVRDQTGDITFFKMKVCTRMEKVFSTYAKRLSVPVNALRFLIDGERINPSQSPRDLDLKDGDQIDCMLEQQGD